MTKSLLSAMMLIAAVAGSGRAVGQELANQALASADSANTAFDGGRSALASESFVPSVALAYSATIELRSEATVIGREVKLKSVCRWSKSDARFFTPVADLTIATIDPHNPFHAVTYDQVRSALAGAGVNLGNLHFTGPLKCTITRDDAESPTPQQSLDQWAAAHVPAVVQTAATMPVASTQAASTQASEATRSLASLLAEDLATHLQLPAQSLQIDFNPQDEKLVALAEPAFKFQIIPQRVHDLGQVRWDVVIISNAGGTRKATVDATARAWCNQVIAVRPLGYRQLILDTDLAERRVLVERQSIDPLLTREQIVGQQTARQISPESVITSHCVEAVPLVKTGQLVTVTLSRGDFQITTVARALESGTLGSPIHVKSESTKDMLDAVVTGPQAAKVE